MILPALVHHSDIQMLAHSPQHDALLAGCTSAEDTLHIFTAALSGHCHSDSTA
jgi:hypothetical protein